jgi:hypothetical protein
MPKKIAQPIATLTLRFDPVALRIQSAATGWVVRARQSSILGFTWIVIAHVDNEREALAIADDLAHVGHFETNGTYLTRKGHTR